MPRVTRTALVALILLVSFGPLIGGAKHTNVANPLTAAPVAEHQWEFDHSGFCCGAAGIRVNDFGYLPRSPRSLVLLDESSFEPLWELPFDDEITSLELLTLEGQQHTFYMVVYSGDQAIIVDLSSGIIVRVVQSASQITGFQLVETLDTYRPQHLIVWAGEEGSLIDLATGDLMWTFPRPMGGYSLLVVGDTLTRRHYHMRAQNVVVVDLHTGERLWSVGGSAEFGEWIGFFDESAAVANEGIITLYDLTSGDVRWTAPYHPSNYGIHNLEGRLILLDEDFVTELDLQTGDSRWKAEIPGQKKFVMEDHDILTIESDGLASGVNLITGEITWQVTTGAFESEPSNRYGNGNTGLVKLSDGTYVQYSGVTGKLLYHLDTYPGDVFTPKYTLFRLDQYVQVINIETTAIVLEFDLPTATSSFNAKLSGDWLIYAVGTDLKAANLITGTEHVLANGEAGLSWAFETYGDVVIVLVGNSAEIREIATGELIANVHGGDFMVTFERRDMIFIFDGETVSVFDVTAQKVLFEREATDQFVGNLDNGTSIWAIKDTDQNIIQLQGWDTAGNTLWTITPTSPLELIVPEIVGDNPTLWVSDNNVLYAINSESGEVMMQVSIPEGVSSTDTLVGRDQVLVYSYEDETTRLYNIP